MNESLLICVLECSYLPKKDSHCTDVYSIVVVPHEIFRNIQCILIYIHEVNPKNLFASYWCVDVIASDQIVKDTVSSERERGNSTAFSYTTNLLGGTMVTQASLLSSSSAFLLCFVLTILHYYRVHSLAIPSSVETNKMKRVLVIAIKELERRFVKNCWNLIRMFMSF